MGIQAGAEPFQRSHTVGEDDHLWQRVDPRQRWIVRSEPLRTAIHGAHGQPS